MKNNIEPRTTLLNYVYQMLQIYSKSVTTIPRKFKDQVTGVKDLLQSDTSGMINSILDFAISAANVPIRIDTTNSNFTKKLNEWMFNINSSLRGRVPVGIAPLAKEYFIERWKGSSLIVMRTIWEEVDGFQLPTKIWFVNGGMVEIEDDQDSVVLGSEKYFLRINSKERKSLPITKNEMIFIQRPYESWGSHYPTPFIIQRGLFKNASMLNLFANKGESIVASALEYLLLMRKGTEGLAKLGRDEFTYTNEEYKEIKSSFDKIIADKRSGHSGVPLHVSSFDTEFQELVPEYEKVLKQSIFSAVEKRILNGLGILEIITNTSNSRTEGLLNPKPFISDVNSAADDFATLIDDLATEILIRNKDKHNKYTSNIVKIHRDPIKEFLDKDAKEILRGLFDRGCISYQTAVEVIGEGDYELELIRTENEEKNGIRKLMKPHPAVPGTDLINVNPEKREKNIDEKKDETNKDKYENADVTFSDYPISASNNAKKALEWKERTGNPEDYGTETGWKRAGQLANREPITLSMVERTYSFLVRAKGFYDSKEKDSSGTVMYLAWGGASMCKWCKKILGKEEKELEISPYNKNADLPDTVKVLPKRAQTIWRKAFNNSLEQYGDEEKAIKVAWSVVKKLYKKIGDEWVKREVSEIGETDEDIAYYFKENELLDKKSELLNLLIDEAKYENIQ